METRERQINYDAEQEREKAKDMAMNQIRVKRIEGK